MSIMVGHVPRNGAGSGARLAERGDQPLKTFELVDRLIP
jgi:hypothetical protein